MAQGLELVSDEAIAEARVIAVGVDGVVDQVGVGEIAVADRFGPPLEIALPGEAEHPTSHRDGDALVSEIRDQRVHHFGLRPRPREMAARRKISFSCSKRRTRFLYSRRSLGSASVKPART